MKVSSSLLLLLSVFVFSSAHAQNVNVTALEARVAKNDPVAELELGRAYHLGGHGVVKDYKKAADLYQKAAAQGNAKAMYNLGYIYYHGQGVVSDEMTASQWFQKSADAGLPAGELEIGLAYFHGDSGEKRDYAAAATWLGKAAEQKADPAAAGSALNGMGSLYENGWGVSRDLNKAVASYREGAEMDNTLAQSNLGRVYNEGAMVKRDPLEAYVWYRLAAANGDPLALHSLTELLEGSTLTQQQIAEGDERVNKFRNAHHKPMLVGPAPKIIIPGEEALQRGPASTNVPAATVPQTASGGNTPGH